MDQNEQYSSFAKVVIVEDDADLATIYKTRLEALGYICFIAHDGIEALAVTERERPSLVLLDIMLPKISGDQFLEVLRKTQWGKSVKVLVVSNLNENDAPPGIRTHGIEDYAVKANLSEEQFDRMVDKILKPTDQQESVSLENPPEASAAPPA